MSLTLLLSFVGFAAVAIASYVVWFRLKESRKRFSSYTTSWEAVDGVDFSGKIAIVTGSNSGIGKETVRAMFAKNCRVIMGCRSVERATAARIDITSSTESRGGSIEIMPLDLSSLQSVREFAAAFSAQFHSLDFLVLNAGIMAVPEFRASSDGYELQFAVNHIGHQYLTMLLADVLVASKSRVVALSSVAHGWATESEFEQFLAHGLKHKEGPSRERYRKWVNYALSKCSNILFAREVQRRYGGDGVLAVSAHPGVIGATGLSEEVQMDWDTVRLMATNMATPSWFMNEIKSIEQGAATTLRCVAMPRDEVQGGHYYVNCHSGTLARWMRPAAADRKQRGRRLWALTETLIAQRGFPLQLQ